MPRQDLRQDPIPFVTLPNWVKAAARCGFNIEPVFRECGIETDLIHLETASVSPQTLDRVMDACVLRAQGQHFPFVLGELFAFEYLPDLETFVTTSPTLREAARVFEWVRTLINPMIQVRLDERGKRAALVLDLEIGGRALKPYYAESIFASVVRFARTLLGPQRRFDKITFRHAAPPYAAEYRRHFDAPIEFGRRSNALVFERALLDLPLGGAYPALHRQAELLVERRVAHLPKKPSLIAAIEQAYAERPALIGQGIARLAQHLGLSARTLQRRLQEQGQSFAEVQGHARYRRAVACLQESSDDVDAISEQLGFSDRRSFTRAFRRWSGQTPSAFRARAPK